MKADKERREVGDDMPQSVSNPLSRDNDDEFHLQPSDSNFGPDRSDRRGQRRAQRDPYSRPQSRADGAWTRDGGRGARDFGNGGRSTGKVTSVSLGAKRVLVSNLDSEVTEDDVQDIFENAGDLTNVTVHYDDNGRSKGTALVMFAKSAQAAAAAKEYDGAEVDGRPMYLRLVDSSGNAVSADPPAKRNNVVRVNGNGRSERSAGKASMFGSALGDRDDFVPRERNTRGHGSFTGGRGFGGGFGGGRRDRAPRAGGRGGRTTGGNRGGGRTGGKGGKGRGPRENKPAPSAEDLDAEMDSYFAAKSEE